jgi:hypothetical protein
MPAINPEVGHELVWPRLLALAGATGAGSCLAEIKIQGRSNNDFKSHLIHRPPHASRPKRNLVSGITSPAL